MFDQFPLTKQKHNPVKLNWRNNLKFQQRQDLSDVEDYLYNVKEEL